MKTKRAKARAKTTKRSPTKAEVRRAMRVIAKAAQRIHEPAGRIFAEQQRAWAAHAILTANGFFPVTWSNVVEHVDLVNRDEPAFNGGEEDFSLDDIKRRFGVDS